MDKTLPKPQPESWMALSVGKNCRVAAHIRLRENPPLIGVDLTLGKGAKDFFRLLEAKESDIRKEIQFKGVSEKLDWQERPDKVESWILIRRKANPLDREDWPKQHQWLATRLEAFYEVFKRHIGQLKLAQ